MRTVLILAVLAASVPAAPAAADTLVAARTIRARTMLTGADVALGPGAGGLTDPAAAIGREARRTLYKGQPIQPEDLTTPATIERNQTVMLAYRAGPLTILAEGRALGRAGPGDAVRVMNLASRATVSGIVAGDGSVLVPAAD
jgi:flagella basal body P-ring formation protein FlgA